jgi:hypothetical protein
MGEPSSEEVTVPVTLTCAIAVLTSNTSTAIKIDFFID